MTFSVKYPYVYVKYNYKQLDGFPRVNMYMFTIMNMF